MAPFQRPVDVPPTPTRLQIMIDRLRFVLGVVAILAIVITFTLNHFENTAQDERITRIESPCLRYGPNSRQCRETFDAAIKSLTPGQACYIAALRRADPTPFCRSLGFRRAPGFQIPPPEPGEDSSSGSGSSNEPQRSPAPKDDDAAPAPVRVPQPSTPPAAADPQPEPAGPPAPIPSRNDGPGKAPTPPAASNALLPDEPVLEVEAPQLPAQVCAPGVVSVNCLR